MIILKVMMICLRHVLIVCTGEKRNVYRILVGKLEEKKPLGIL
jgi:hypothetical protein